MTEKLKWTPRRKKIIERANELAPYYRASFLETARRYEFAGDSVCEELDITVAKGQEWRVEKLLKGDYGKGKIYTRKKKARKRKTRRHR